MEVLLVSQKTPPILDGVELPLKEWICSLKVLFNPGLLLDRQMAAVGSSAFYQL